jgi:exonuclease III
MSHSTSQNQRLKIEAITDIRADIIFLSDLRMGNKNLTSAKNDISNMFLINSSNSYNLIANSTQNKRGVGILLSRNLNYTVLETGADPGENFLILKISLGEQQIILVSVYGPNNHDPVFFQSLFRALKNMGDIPIVMGGDFNTTFSSEKIENNIDCCNMVDLPNFRHSVYVNEFCEALNLTDPYRVLYPVKREYSYKPFGNTRKNRSRIDFFLVSNSLLDREFECSINKYTLGTFFDHKPIFLKFKAKNKNKKRKTHLKINEAILRDPDIDIVLWFTVFETYLHYLRVDPALITEINRTLAICGQVRSDFRDAGPDLCYYVNTVTPEIIESRNVLIQRVKNTLVQYPIELLYNFELTISDDLFMEVLLNNVRNEITSYQGFIKNLRKKNLKT